MKLLTQFDGSYTQVPQVKQVVEFSERVSEFFLNVLKRSGLSEDLKRSNTKAKSF